MSKTLEEKLSQALDLCRALEYVVKQQFVSIEQEETGIHGLAASLKDSLQDCWRNASRLQGDSGILPGGEAPFMPEWTAVEWYADTWILPIWVKQQGWSFITFSSGFQCVFGPDFHKKTGLQTHKDTIEAAKNFIDRTDERHPTAA